MVTMTVMFALRTDFVDRIRRRRWAILVRSCCIS
jgi:hypothetical protein